MCNILPGQHGNLPIVKEVKAVVRFLSIDFHRDNERMNRPGEYGKRRFAFTYKNMVMNGA